MLAAALLTISALTHAQTHQATPQPLPQPPPTPIPTIDTWHFGEIDTHTLRAQDANATHADFTNRFAQPFEQVITPAESGTLTQSPDNTLTWTLRLHSTNGLSVNFGSLFKVPPSTVINLRDAQGIQTTRPITAADNMPHNQFWSPIVRGPVMEIQATVNADEWRDFEAGFTITRVSFGYRDITPPDDRNPSTRGVFATDSCLVDIMSPLGDPWRPIHAKGVGLYTIEGVLTCSGAMINNTAQNQDPIFLTADHCQPIANPAAIVVYWNMQNTVCRPPYSQASGEIGDGQYTDYTLGGATIIADYPDADFVLMRLNNTPDPAFGVEWLGWDRSESIPDWTVGICHPGVQERRIHKDYEPPIITTFDATHAGFSIIRTWLIQVEEGGVQGGTSGSALFDHNGRIIGTATTARPRKPEPNYCPQQIIEYGRLSYAWNNDPNVPAALDPLSTNQLTLDYLGFTPPPTCPADLDNDNDTDVLDFAIFAATFGAPPLAPHFNPAADFDNDDDVDVIDFGVFATDFGCPN